MFSITFNVVSSGSEVKQHMPVEQALYTSGSGLCHSNIVCMSVRSVNIIPSLGWVDSFDKELSRITSCGVFSKPWAPSKPVPSFQEFNIKKTGQYYVTLCEQGTGGSQEKFQHVKKYADSSDLAIAKDLKQAEAKWKAYMDHSGAKEYGRILPDIDECNQPGAWVGASTSAAGLVNQDQLETESYHKVLNEVLKSLDYKEIAERASPFIQ